MHAAKGYVTQGVLDNFRNFCVYIPEKAGNPDVDTREATPLSEETYPAKGPRRGQGKSDKVERELIRKYI